MADKSLIKLLFGSSFEELSIEERLKKELRLEKEKGRERDNIIEELRSNIDWLAERERKTGSLYGKRERKVEAIKADIEEIKKKIELEY